MTLSKLRIFLESLIYVFIIFNASPHLNFREEASINKARE